MGAGGPGREGGRGVGENGEEAKGIPFPSSPWAAVERGVLATGAGGPGCEGGREVGENGEEAEGVRFPSSP